MTTAPDLIREFNAKTADRLPTVDELLSLCDGCGITFTMRDGEPCMKCPKENRPVAELVKELIKDEPWRSEVIARRINGVDVPPDLKVPERSSGCSHSDRTTFVDEPDPERIGWIRTSCMACGAFIGCRPKE